jgi:hypothetical protein
LPTVMVLMLPPVLTPAELPVIFVSALFLLGVLVSNCCCSFFFMVLYTFIVAEGFLFFIKPEFGVLLCCRLPKPDVALRSPADAYSLLKNSTVPFSVEGTIEIWLWMVGVLDWLC